MWSELTWFMWSDFVLKWNEVMWSELTWFMWSDFVLKWSEVMWSELAWFMWSDFILKWSEVIWSELTWFMWSDFILKWSEVKWVSMKVLGTKVLCTLGWPYTEGTWLYCDYFIWCVSCTVVVCHNIGSHTVSTEHAMSLYWNVCLMMFTVTETCIKLYIIDYIVVFWLNDILVCRGVAPKT